LGNKNKCDCKFDFYDLGVLKDCLPCQNKCHGCLDIEMCLDCKGKFRENLTLICRCMEGYTDLGYLKDCLPCDYKCGTCFHLDSC
jgi:hypothetical protein